MSAIKTKKDMKTPEEFAKKWIEEREKGSMNIGAWSIEDVFSLANEYADYKHSYLSNVSNRVAITGKDLFHTGHYDFRGKVKDEIILCGFCKTKHPSTYACKPYVDYKMNNDC